MVSSVFTCVTWKVILLLKLKVLKLCNKCIINVIYCYFFFIKKGYLYSLFIIIKKNKKYETVIFKFDFYPFGLCEIYPKIVASQQRCLIHLKKLV